MQCVWCDNCGIVLGKCTPRVLFMTVKYALKGRFPPLKREIKLFMISSTCSVFCSALLCQDTLSQQNNRSPVQTHAFVRGAFCAREGQM